jgi:putative acetyltransferase
MGHNSTIAARRHFIPSCFEGINRDHIGIVELGMGQGMQIRRATPEDRDVLFDVWLRSVEATHTFVSAADLEAFKPLVREYLASNETEFWVLCDAEGAKAGFMGMAGPRVESLFLAPEFHRRGGGRRLVEHARTRHGELTVDVNEQNAAAVAFYQACGFVAEGRSELDESGRPYPLLHMRLAARP